jgi:hypothetical protein
MKELIPVCFAWGFQERLVKVKKRYQILVRDSVLLITQLAVYRLVSFLL